MKTMHRIKLLSGSWERSHCDVAAKTTRSFKHVANEDSAEAVILPSEYQSIEAMRKRGKCPFEYEYLGEVDVKPPAPRDSSPAKPAAPAGAAP